jgi:lysophospholipase L1-like esterase
MAHKVAFEKDERRNKSRFRITSIIIAVVMLAGAFGVLIGPFTINVSAAPDTHTWDGGGANASASTKENWVGDVAPEAGDSVIFDAGALPCSWDLSITLNAFSMNAGYTGIISPTVSFGTTGDIIASAGTFTPTLLASDTITCAGNINIGAGCTWNPWARLIMTGASTSITRVAALDVRDLTVSASSVSLIMGDRMYVQSKLIVDVGASIIMGGAGNLLELIPEGNYPYTFYNNGSISGGWMMVYADQSCTAKLGVITSPVTIAGDATSTVTMGGIATLTTLTVSSSGILIGSSDTLSVSGTTALSGNMTQGTGAWTFGTFTQSDAGSKFWGGSGGLTINGVYTISNGLSTQGGNMVVSGNIVASGGTFTPLFLGSYTITCHGNITVGVGCTWEVGARLIMTGNSTAITRIAEIDVNALRVSASSVSLVMGDRMYVQSSLIVDPGASIIIATGWLEYYPSGVSPYTFINEGNISSIIGASFVLALFQNFTGTLGIIDAWTVVMAGGDFSYTMNGSDTLASVTLTGGSIIGSSGTLYISQMINTAGVMTQGTGAWEFGSYLQTGASCEFNGGPGGLTIGRLNQEYLMVNDGDFNADGTITCYGDVDFTGATVVAGDSTLKMEGAKHLAISQELYNFEISPLANVVLNQTTDVNGELKAYGTWSGIVEIHNSSIPVLVQERLKGTVSSLGNLTIEGTTHQLSAIPISGGVFIANLSFDGISDPIDVVEIGDSHAAVHAYTDQLSLLMGIGVFNEGIGGQNTVDILARFATDVLSYHPDYVIFQIGFNDIVANTAPAVIEANLLNLYTQSIAAGIKVVANTIFPYVGMNAFMEANRTLVNNWMIAQASSMIIVVDAGTFMADPLNPLQLNPIYTTDLIHPNVAGGNFWANQTYSQAFAGHTYLVHADGIIFDANATSTVSFTLSGLESGVGYKVYVDGVLYYQQLKGLTDLTFTYSGPWSEHTFEVVAWDMGNPDVTLDASFSYSIDGNLVSFTDKSYGGAVVWIWNFGDGSGSTKQSPTHTYKASGKYTVSLTVYDSDGHSSKASVEITLALGPNFPVERNPSGWDIYISDQLTVSMSAVGLLVGGAIMFVSAIFLPSVPFITPKGRKLIGALMILAGLYFLIFVDNSWMRF